MSLDANTLVRLIKKAASDVIEASYPFAMKIGEVVSTNPLKISINQKITVPASQLLLTNAVRDHTIVLTKEDDGADDAEESEDAAEESSDKTYTAHCALSAGEKVLLLRCDGGQQFIVLDRLEAP